MKYNWFCYENQALFFIFHYTMWESIFSVSGLVPFCHLRKKKHSKKMYIFTIPFTLHMSFWSHQKSFSLIFECFLFSPKSAQNLAGRVMRNTDKRLNGPCRFKITLDQQNYFFHTWQQFTDNSVTRSKGTIIIYHHAGVMKSCGRVVGGDWGVIKPCYKKEGRGL